MSFASMARAVIPVDVKRVRDRASSLLAPDSRDGKIEGLRRAAVGLRDRTSMFNRIFAGKEEDRGAGDMSTSPEPLIEGSVSDRFGECVRLEIPLLSPFILSCIFFRTR